MEGREGGRDHDDDEVGSSFVGYHTPRVGVVVLHSPDVRGMGEVGVGATNDNRCARRRHGPSEREMRGRNTRGSGRRLVGRTIKK